MLFSGERVDRREVARPRFSDDLGSLAWAAPRQSSDPLILALPIGEETSIH